MIAKTVKCLMQAAFKGFKGKQSSISKPVHLQAAA